MSVRALLVAIVCWSIAGMVATTEQAAGASVGCHIEPEPDRAARRTVGGGVVYQSDPLCSGR